MEEYKQTFNELLDTMTQSPIDYKDIIEAGFKVEETYDSIFKAEYGFDYKIVTLDLSKRLYLEWDTVTRFVTFARIDKSYNILAQMMVYDKDHMLNIIEFFTKKKT